MFSVQEGVNRMEDNGMVLACSVEDCSWWRNRECHAKNISVGDEHPTCDAFTTGMVDPQDEVMPPVDNCMVEHCKYNEQQCCIAPGITVGRHAQHADCETCVPMA